MLYIVRGIPGAGKSYFAENHLKPFLESQGRKVEHWENDMYFIDPITGAYCWEGDKMGAAIHWCQMGVECAFTQRGCDDVIVCNTHTVYKEFKHYIELAERLGIQYKVLFLDGHYKNQHSVPLNTINAMRSRFKPFAGEVNGYAYLERLQQSYTDLPK